MNYLTLLYTKFEVNICKQTTISNILQPSLECQFSRARTGHNS